ncbi:MAG: SDR family oxidoreductase [Rikenellaceae bacterium]
MKNIFDIEGKVIVMTGATGVLGTPIAAHLAQNGAQVVLLARNEAKAKAVAEAVGEGVAYFIADALDRESLQVAYDGVIESFGRVDVLINLAGGNQAGATIPDDKTLYDLEVDAVRGVMDLNLMGTLLPTLVFSRSMADRGEGSIINIASLSALRPLTRVMGYGMAKAGIVNLTQYLSGEMAAKFSKKIRVNAVAPGFFLTEQNRTLLTNEDGSYTPRAEKIIAHTPFERFGEPEELLGAIHYLASDASSFTTGEVMVIDGGFNAYSI